MAESVTATGVSSPVAADVIAGEAYQRIKLGLGVDGSSADAVGGAGAADAGTIRTISATDDPAVTALSTVNATLTTINANTDTLEALTTAMSAKLPASLGVKTAANSLSMTVASDDALLSAMAAIRDSTATINVAPDTSVIKNANADLTPKFAAIAASTSGNNTLVAAVTAKKIRVLAYNLIGNGAVNAKFQSGASGTDLTGLKYIAAAGGGICAPFNPVGWFETGAGVLLNLNLSGAVAVGGELVYVEV